MQNLSTGTMSHRILLVDDEIDILEFVRYNLQKEGYEVFTAQNGAEALKAAGRPDDEFAFVVHGTMADPRWLDPTVDPNERTPGQCYLGDPEVVNMSPVGLARFCTLRSWLSQWSYDDANGDAVKAGPDIAVPTLVIGNLADDACTPSHTRRLFEAIGHPDKEMYEIAGANHYYSGPDQRETLAKAVGIVTDWLARHDFAKVEA